MLLTAAELNRERLRGEVSLLEEQYKAVNDQILLESDPGQKVVLKRQAENYLKEYSAKAGELEQLENQLVQQTQRDRSARISESSSPRRHDLHLEQQLPRINYSKVSKLMPQIVRDDPDGVAAAFLLHDSYRMCGDLCLKLIIEFLSSKNADPPRHIEVGFAEYQTPSPRDFLLRMGVNKEVLDASDLTSAVVAVTERICAGLGNGGVVLIELNMRQSLEDYEDFVAWFLTAFWGTLVNKLPQIKSGRRYVKMIALIRVSSAVPKSALMLYRCGVKNFSQTKLLDLPLEKWGRREIKEWLFKYSGLGSHQTPEQIERTADVIHKDCKSPKAVYDRIREILSQQDSERSV